MTRLRYSKDKEYPTLLVSNTAVILPNGKAVSIVLDTEVNTYSFLHGNESVSTGQSNNLLNLKKLVRTTLLELGVPLEKEVKKSKKSQTEEAA